MPISLVVIEAIRINVVVSLLRVTVQLERSVLQFVSK